MCPILALRGSVLQISTALKVYLLKGHVITVSLSKELQTLHRAVTRQQSALSYNPAKGKSNTSVDTASTYKSRATEIQPALSGRSGNI